METTQKETTTRIDSNVDDMERVTDYETDKIGKKSEAPAQHESATGKTQSDTTTEIDNPFKPRASLSRSPTRLTMNQGNNQEKGDEEDVFEVMVIQPAGAVKRNATEQNDGAKQADGLLVSRDALKKMIKRAREATIAVNAIFGYAAATKNVNRILKEKSGIALTCLESLAKDLEWTHRHGQGSTGAEVAVGIGKTVTVNTATQTEDPVYGEDRTSITTMDGQEGRRQKARKETSIDIRENNPEVVETMAIMGGGDKRKEISPPEQTKAKRSRPNARVTGNAIQSARWVNEPLRGEPNV